MFATPTIVGELKRHFRDKGWAVRVPWRIQELHLQLISTAEILSHKLGRSPTIPEIARHTGVSVDDVLESIEHRLVISSPVGSLPSASR